MSCPSGAQSDGISTGVGFSASFLWFFRCSLPRTKVFLNFRGRYGIVGYYLKSNDLYDLTSCLHASRTMSKCDSNSSVKAATNL